MGKDSRSAMQSQKLSRALKPSWDGEFYTKYFCGPYDFLTGLTGWRTDISRHAVENLPKGKLLDVGCGTGFVLKKAKDEGFDVKGIDPSSGMLEKAKEKHGFENGDLIEASANSIPFKDNTFDVVLATGSLIHISDIDPTAKEMARVLKPGGRLRVIDHVQPPKKSITQKLWKYFVTGTGYILHPYDKIFQKQSLKLVDHKILARGGYLQLFDFEK